MTVCLLSVQRIRTWLRSDDSDSSTSAREGREVLIDDSAELAELEGLHGHAAAARMRRRA
jgi:hypothetical protein